MSWTRISVRYGAQPIALFSDLTVRCWWLWIPEMMRRVTIGKIRQLCSDKGSSMATGLSPLWEDGTVSPCHLSSHVNLIHMSSTADLGTEKLQGRCGSPGRARLTCLLPAALKWLSWCGGRGKIRRDEVREKWGGCDWLKNWTWILHFYLGVFFIHTLVRASWWTGGPPCPLTLGSVMGLALANGIFTDLMWGRIEMWLLSWLPLSVLLLLLWSVCALSSHCPFSLKPIGDMWRRATPVESQTYKQEKWVFALSHWYFVVVCYAVLRVRSWPIQRGKLVCVREVSCWWEVPPSFLGFQLSLTALS